MIVVDQAASGYNPAIMWRGIATALAVSALMAPAAGGQETPAVPGRSALEPVTTGGLEVVDRALAKLSTHRRLLMIGAHPDDEDTAMLTLVARGLGGEAAYLALSRGDGGQNLIGPDLGVGLGVLRTQELVSARRVDGAHQYFTRAFDFGYIRSLDETLRRWPREALLEDVARIVWRFRPQVLVAMFSADGGGGHGQHRASGWVAGEVFPIAGDPDRFPGLVAEGWVPWQPETFFRRTFFDPERASMRFGLGDLDSLSGESMLQIAMRSRSQHRSQDMGMLQPLGTRRGGVEWVAGGAGPETDDLFAGVDTRLEAMAAPIADSALRAEVEGDLSAAAATARQTRAALSPAAPPAAVGGIARILSLLRRARETAATAPGESPRRAVVELIDEKIAVAQAGLAAAAGLGFEAVAGREALAPGQATEVTLSVWNAGDQTVEAETAALQAAAAWTTEPTDGTATLLAPTSLAEWTFRAQVREGASPTRPYYLHAPRRGDLFDWSGAPPAVRGLPGQAPELVAVVDLRVAGQPVRMTREVVRRVRDQAIGEVRRPLRVVPKVEIEVEPSLVLWDPRDRESREIRLTLHSHLEGAVRGRVEAEAPEGWEAGEPEFVIDRPGARVQVPVRLRPTGPVERGAHEIRFVVRLEDGTTSALSVPLMEFDHVRPVPLPVAAVVRVSAFTLDLPELGTVGYVRGASDRVPEYLEQVGVPIELLGGEVLATGDLSRFQVIVIGSRAYETDSDLVAANGRLLDWVRSGGRLVVQYQQYQFVRGAYAPYELEIGRPHDRITDETAPVRLLEPDHAVFRRPNRIGTSDWDGWVQERGLYFANNWAEAFQPLLALRDPGLEEQSGGLLVARVGDGLYVYTGLAFFRQLPAGVGGGYRLLANLLALE